MNIETLQAKDYPSKTVNTECLKRVGHDLEEYNTFHRSKDSKQNYSTKSKEQYLVKKKTFSQQFSNLYFVRLKSMKSKLESRAVKLFPSAKLAQRVLELKQGNSYLVVGTLYKEMKMKPNILEEYTREYYEVEDAVTTVSSVNRIEDDDTIVLEDLSGRVTLKFAQKGELDHKAQVDQLVTGIIVGCHGQVDELGHFVVSDLITADFPPQLELPRFDDDQYVALVCGIGVGHPQFNLLNTQMMIDYLTGTVCGETEQEKLISKIARTVIVGNSNYAPDEKRGRLFDVRGSLRPAERASLVEPTKAVDRLVEQLAYSMHVDIMPGDQDPSNTSLPQQPLHPSLFPKSAHLSTCHLVTNPYQFNSFGVEFLGVSGQTIDDMRKYCAETNTLNLMESTLKWAHIAPTAPDTLNCYPFNDVDPFILGSTPHVYFAGNQPSFETRLAKSGNKTVRLISLPAFATSGLLVLVNLRTLDVHPIQFDTESLAL